MTPNIFITYFAQDDEPSGGPAPKWQPVATLTVTLESGEVLVLERQAAAFEIGGDVQLKAVTHAAYHAPTNTIYYYNPVEADFPDAPRLVVEADWKPLAYLEDEKRGQPES